MPRRRRKSLVTVNGQPLTRELAQQIYATYGSPTPEQEIPYWEVACQQLVFLRDFEPPFIGALRLAAGEQPDEPYFEFDDISLPVNPKQRARIEEHRITRNQTGSRARKINRAKLPPRRARRRRSPKNLGYIPRTAIAA